MPRIAMRFDLCVAPFAATTFAVQHRAMLEMASWADRVGIGALSLSEHHGDPAGFTSAPVVLAYLHRLHRLKRRRPDHAAQFIPDTYDLQDAARLAATSMLARMDLQRQGQPFFRIEAFANPPRAQHEKWDDGDMTGRYVEGLLRARAMTGLPIDPREALLRQYLAGLFDENNGLCYTRQAE